MDWLDLLAVQGTLKSLLQQFESINSSVLTFLYSPTLTSILSYYEGGDLPANSFKVLDDLLFRAEKIDADRKSVV